MCLRRSAFLRLLVSWCWASGARRASGARVRHRDPAAASVAAHREKHGDAGSIANLQAAEVWRVPFLELRSRIEQMPPKDQLDPRCYPIVEIPEEPPECFILLVHGFTACPFAFNEFASLMMDHKKCLVVMPTLPGHGMSKGGATHNLPGGKGPSGDRDCSPQPEVYMDFTLELALAFRDAGIASIPTKSMFGLSLGALVVAQLTVLSDVPWDNVLIANPAWRGPYPFAAKNNWKMSFDSPVLKATKALHDIGLCSRFKDQLFPEGYCHWRAGSMRTLFEFGDAVREVWDTTHFLKKDPSSRASKLTHMSDGVEKFLRVLNRSDEDGTIRALLDAGTKHLATSSTLKLQFVATIKDPAIDSMRVAKSFKVAAPDQKQICYFPKVAGHTWPTPISVHAQTFWWLSSVRATTSRFLLFGEFLPLEYGTTQTCFMDIFTDADLATHPFSGKSYTTEIFRYHADPYDKDGKVDITDDVFEFSSSGKPWPMMRAHVSGVSRYLGMASGSGAMKSVSVQVILRSDDDSVPLIIERDAVEDAARTPVRKAQVVEHFTSCTFSHAPRKTQHASKGSYTLCLSIKSYSMMDISQPGQFADIVMRKRLNEIKTDPKDYIYCGRATHVKELCAATCQKDGKGTCSTNIDYAT